MCLKSIRGPVPRVCTLKIDEAQPKNLKIETERGRNPTIELSDRRGEKTLTLEIKSFAVTSR